MRFFKIVQDEKQQVVVISNKNEIFYVARNRNLVYAIEECLSYMSNFPEVQVVLSDSLHDYMQGRPKKVK